jgi:hypothetical protein
MEVLKKELLNPLWVCCTHKQYRRLLDKSNRDRPPLSLASPTSLPSLHCRSRRSARMAQVEIIPALSGLHVRPLRSKNLALKIFPGTRHSKPNVRD